MPADSHVVTWVEGRREMARSSTQQRSRRQRGIALTEFAIVGGLLFTLLFGIIEFGWVFYQYQDVRQGAREGARIAAVEESWTGAQVIAEACSRMEDDGTTVQLDSHGNEIGDPGDIIVRRRVDTLTGYLDPVIGAFLDVESTVRFRVEQTKVWGDTAATPC